MQGEILNKVFEAAKEKLTNVDDKVYKEFIEKKLANFSKDGIELVLQEGRKNFLKILYIKFQMKKLNQDLNLFLKRKL